MLQLVSRCTPRALRLSVLLIAVLGPCGLARGGDAETNLMTNGSFELWSHYGQEGLDDLLRSGGSYDDPKDPLIPVRWDWRLAGNTSLKRSADAHGGKSVSYTHLDVYKRQSPGCWSLICSPRNARRSI